MGPYLIWRRGRDSNPRWAFNPYSLSRGAPSATRPPLRDIYDQLFAGVIIPKNARDDSRCALIPSGPPSRCDDVVSHLRCSARTLDGLLTHTPLAGERVTRDSVPRPAGHRRELRRSTHRFTALLSATRPPLRTTQLFGAGLYLKILPGQRSSFSAYRNQFILPLKQPFAPPAKVTDLHQSAPDQGADW
jgi:hypothetical protein